MIKERRSNSKNSCKSGKSFNKENKHELYVENACNDLSFENRSKKGIIENKKLKKGKKLSKSEKKKRI